MRRVERQPYEERSRAIFRDESHRRFGEHIAAIALHFYGHPVVLENGVEITFPARRIRWLANAPAFEHQRFLKTLVDGAQRVIVAQVPFAEDARAITRRRKHFAERDFVRMHQRATEEGIDHASAIVVATSQQTRTCRRANGRDVKVVEAHTLAREPVDVRRMQDGIAVKAKVAMALIVGENDDDVGMAGNVGQRILRKRLCKSSKLQTKNTKQLDR